MIVIPSRELVTVQLVNNATSVPPISLNLEQIGTIYRTPLDVGQVKLVGSGGTEEGYVYAASGYPSGWTLDTATGYFSGTAAAQGHFTISATVTDSALNSITLTFSVFVASRLTVVNGTPPNAEHNYSYNATSGGSGYQFSVAGATGSVTWAVTSGSTPACSGGSGHVDLSSGGLLNQSNTVSSSGGTTYNFVATATDSGTGDTLDINCKINVYSEFKTTVTPGKHTITVGVPLTLTAGQLGLLGGAPNFAIGALTAPAALSLIYNSLDGSATLTASASFAKTGISASVTDSLGISPGGIGVFITAINPNQEITILDATGAPAGDPNPLTAKLHSSDASVTVTTSVDASGNWVTDLSGAGGSSSTPVIALTNGEASAAIVAGMAVYISAASTVKRALASSTSTWNVFALCIDVSVAAAASGNFQYDDIVTLTTAQWDAVTGGSGGLTPGSFYYLDNSTAGHLTTVAPANVAVLGQALSTTKFRFAPRTPE